MRLGCALLLAEREPGIPKCANRVSLSKNAVEISFRDCFETTDVIYNDVVICPIFFFYRVM